MSNIHNVCRIGLALSWFGTCWLQTKDGASFFVSEPWQLAGPSIQRLSLSYFQDGRAHTTHWAIWAGTMFGVRLGLLWACPFFPPFLFSFAHRGQNGGIISPSSWFRRKPCYQWHSSKAVVACWLKIEWGWGCFCSEDVKSYQTLAAGRLRGSQSSNEQENGGGDQRLSKASMPLLNLSLPLLLTLEQFNHGKKKVITN